MRREVIAAGPVKYRKPRPQDISIFRLEPGGRLPHHMETHCVCRERGPPVLQTRESAINALREQYILFGDILRLLKLVTGVDISTRPVNRSGRDGNAKTRSSRTATAAPIMVAFRRSIAML